MRNVDVKITQYQEEEIRPANISKNEEEMLLAKYGYANRSGNYIDNNTNDKSNLTFEELVRLKEEEDRQIRNKNQKDDNNHIVYGTEDDSGYVYKIQIISDMPIPKNY